jgi:hypothetical protein
MAGAGSGRKCMRVKRIGVPILEAGVGSGSKVVEQEIKFDF